MNFVDSVNYYHPGYTFRGKVILCSISCGPQNVSPPQEETYLFYRGLDNVLCLLRPLEGCSWFSNKDWKLWSSAGLRSLSESQQIMLEASLALGRASESKWRQQWQAWQTQWCCLHRLKVWYPRAFAFPAPQTALCKIAVLLLLVYQFIMLHFMYLV